MVETLEAEPRTLRLADLPPGGCVLVLGDPGMGKTTSFRDAADADPGGAYAEVRGFLARPAGRVAPGGTLYLDALDEALAAGVAAPLDAVAGGLYEAGSPRFWLSCRPVEWAAVAGHSLLRDCAGAAGLLAVRLLPLDAGQVEAAARARGVDPERLLLGMEEAGLGPLLRNPQTLGLVLDLASRGGGLPSSRHDLHRRAVELLAREARTDRPRPPAAAFAQEELLEAAGAACACMLLAGRGTVSFGPAADSGGTATLEDLAPAIGDPAALEAALRTRLFAAAGDGGWGPQHRTVAEFLAASFLAGRVAGSGLPLGRVVAWLCGDGPSPHPALRGVFAWLAALLPGDAEGLVARDPYGVLSYGDPARLGPPALGALLRGLQDLADREPFFRAGLWGEARFAALAAPELVPGLRAVLEERPPRAHLLSCALEAMAEGDPRPELVPDLAAFLTDAALPAGRRADAVPALVRACRGDPGVAVDLFRALLEDRALDPDADLAGALLLRLYPAHLGRADLVAFLDRYMSSTGRQRGGDRLHLDYVLSSLVPPGEEAPVLDALAAKPSPARRPVEPLSRPATVGKVALDLLARAIPGVGTHDAPRVAGWLRALDGAGGREASMGELKAALAARPDLFVPMLAAVAARADDASESGNAFSAVWKLRHALPCWPWPADAARRL